MGDGQGFARKHDIKIVSEVSAQSGENIDSLFQKVALTCFQNKDKFVSAVLIPTRLTPTLLTAIAHERDLQVGKARCRRRAGWRQEEGKVLLIYESVNHFAKLEELELLVFPLNANTFNNSW